MSPHSPKPETCRLAAEHALLVTEEITVLGNSPDQWNYAIKEDHEVGILELRWKGHSGSVLYYECETAEIAELAGFYLKQFGLWEAEGPTQGGTGIVAWRRIWA